MGRAAWSVLFAVGCYGPAAHPGSPCDQGTCPANLVCQNEICVEPGLIDARHASDARLIDSATVDGAIPLSPFKTPPTPIPGVNTAAAEDDPTLSANRLTIMFTRGSVGSGTELWMGTRATVGDAFTVAIVTELNSTADEQSPELSADGLTVYFSSAIAGSGDIYKSTRTAGSPTWASPVLVGALSTVNDDNNLAISPNGLTAIVCRIAGGTGTLWRYTRASVGGVFGAATRLTALEISTDIAAPTMTNGAQTIYFHLGAVRDLYASRFTGGGYSTPVPVTELNTPTRDASPFINATDDRIVFEHDGDLYETAR